MCRNRFFMAALTSLTEPTTARELYSIQISSSTTTRMFHSHPHLVSSQSCFKPNFQPLKPRFLGSRERVASGPRSLCLDEAQTGSHLADIPALGLLGVSIMDLLPHPALHCAWQDGITRHTLAGRVPDVPERTVRLHESTLQVCFHKLMQFLSAVSNPLDRRTSRHWTFGL